MKLTIIYIAILVIGSILPINGTDSVINNVHILNIRLDYIVHGLVFIPVYPLLAADFYKRDKEKYANKYFNIKALIFGIIIAIIIEGIQYFIPYRAFNVNDVVGNLIGVGIGVVVWSILLSKIIEN